MPETPTITVPRTDHDMQTWRALFELAITGLRNTYGFDSSFAPHTMQWNGKSAIPRGRNTRYALISLLGLTRARNMVDSDESIDELVESLWARVAHAYSSIANSPGDLGLGLWARALSGGHRLFTAQRALVEFRKRNDACDSVDLAWLLLGADHALLHDCDDGHGEQLADRARRSLLALLNDKSRLFYRRARGGPIGDVSRRIACFANQIYPVMGLAVHARRTGCTKTAAIGREVAENLCRLQGPLGQWWWLYDSRDGSVVDGYPVFSVHQDGMAPMALLETTLAGGPPFSREIDKGVSWIFGNNELRQGLALRDEGLVLRDIHCEGVGRIRRMIRGAAWCLGWHRDREARESQAAFVVNNECRPYHLGWILYAAALVEEVSRRASSLAAEPTRPCDQMNPCAESVYETSE